MGCMFGFSSSTHDKSPQQVVANVETVTKPLSNPDPKSYIILKSKVIGELTVALVKYPDCTNYEGKKIIVMTNEVYYNCIVKQTLDPHFCENKNYCPVARFAPTMWDVAVKFARTQEGSEEAHSPYRANESEKPPQFWLDYYEVTCESFKRPTSGDYVYCSSDLTPAPALLGMNERKYWVVRRNYSPTRVREQTFRIICDAIDKPDSRLRWTSSNVRQWMENVDLTNQRIEVRHKQWILGQYHLVENKKVT